MAFQKVDFNHIAKFNSAASSELLFRYDEHVNNQLLAAASEQPSKAFSPSAFRCDRRSWFKLRGVQPDKLSTPDRVLDFSAQIGTACHRIIQFNLRDLLGNDWVDVSEYVATIGNSELFHCESRDDGLETLISLDNPPVRFACDGLVRIDGEIYLLEIKSSEYNSWNDLTEPKPYHLDQIQCYATLLQLDKVLFIYIDRQYGGLKCYQYRVTDIQKDEILRRFSYVMSMVEKNLAPQGLPVGDTWCSPSYCPYHEKCKEYGR